MLPKINYFLLDWHINKSGAFNQFLIDPLSQYCESRLFSWDGVSILPQFSETKTISIFCQFPPPLNFSFNKSNQIFWVPMWDYSYNHSQYWWKNLPKNFNIIAYSKIISRLAHNAGLKTLDIRFFINPEKISPIDWNNQNTLMYWNRTGLVNIDFLDRMVNELKVQRIIFGKYPDPNPYIPIEYSLPSKIGSAIVEILPNFLPHKEYLDYLNRANLFLAPRNREGVGLSFLEAMAQGTTIFAYDAPTMNEYIQHKQNGILLPSIFPKKLEWLYINFRRIRRRLDKWFNISAGKYSYFLSPNQDWQSIRALNLSQIGSRARQDSIYGYQEWQKSISLLVKYILGSER
jgi:glycosyltransferase involved in cell wall biosynthesis